MSTYYHSGIRKTYRVGIIKNINNRMKKNILVSLLMISLSVSMHARECISSSVENANRMFSLHNAVRNNSIEMNKTYNTMFDVEEISDECSVTIEVSVGAVSVSVTYTASDCATAAKKAVEAAKKVKAQIQKEIRQM